MKQLLILIAFFCVLAVAPPARAQRIDQLPGVATPRTTESIAAVVNDGVISTSDIEQRMKLAMLSAGLPDTPDVRQHLLPQILRGLIDEQLQLQEAKRLDLSVSDAEVSEAMERIAHENNIPGSMRDYVANHGGSAAALEKQIRASLLWSRVVQRELRPRVEVGDDEVDAAVERIRANAGKEEYLAAEIFLAVDNAKDEDQVKQFADNLVQQIKAGVSFGAVARQFSQGTGAAAGGDMGWVQQGQLPPELDKGLTAMSPGDIAGPIRSASGYHILGLREKRTISLGNASDIHVNVQQVFRPYDAGTNRTAIENEGEQLRGAVKDCGGLRGLLAEKFPAWHWQNLGDADLSKMPPMLADKIRDVSAGKSAAPIATDKGALVLFVCERKVKGENVNRENITNILGTEKLELQARRLLRDLHRAAYLDIRLGKKPS